MYLELTHHFSDGIEGNGNNDETCKRRGINNSDENRIL